MIIKIVSFPSFTQHYMTMCSKMLGPTQATKALTPAEIFASGDKYK